MRLLASLLLLSQSLTTALRADPAAVVPLWPEGAPGERGAVGEERDTTRPGDNQVAGRPVVRVGHVSAPSLAIYPPPRESETGAAVVVFPGGAYHILAWDLEGTEVCEWLNSIGITAVLVKYRVPRREGLERHAAPLQDAQRALGLVRHRAPEWGIARDRIGVLGFSAGGHLAAALCSHPQKRTYPIVDPADQVSCRPDFSLLIYPGYLVEKEEPRRLAPEVRVTPGHPPGFTVMTQDDPVGVENALFWFLALKEAGVPSELHIYPTGRHGYGLRRTEQPVTTWPDRAEDWMRSHGWLAPKQAGTRVP